MYAEDLASNDRSDRQGVEYIDKRLPRFDVGSTFALVVETVY
jgi:hypothetical protein